MNVTTIPFFALEAIGWMALAYVMIATGSMVLGALMFLLSIALFIIGVVKK